jgi:MEMO1 family protein
MTELVRDPAVAGRFYPGDPAGLHSAVARYLGVQGAQQRPAIMLMGPHAGYVYSGAIAGVTYAQVEAPDSAIVICPNHTGLGVRRSLWPSGSWRMPGFELSVDTELAELVASRARLTADRMAHLREHAVEVHLPFLHALRANVKIVAICLAGLDYDDCVEVGEGLAAAISEVGSRRAGERVLLVASSDMSHYISAREAKHYDEHALARVLALDPRGLFDVVMREDISMCGYIPTTVSLIAALKLGAQSAELTRYGNSGETSGDFDQVVGYAGVVIR